MKPTILLILTLLSGSVLADDLYLTLGGWSWHDDKYIYNCPEVITVTCYRPKYNNNHKSFIVDYKGFTVGTYKNSYYNRTNLAGYTYREGGFSAVIAYGTGYTVKNVDEACPLKVGKGCALLSIGYTYKHIKLSMIGQALAFSFEFQV